MSDRRSFQCRRGVESFEDVPSPEGERRGVYTLECGHRAERRWKVNRKFVYCGECLSTEAARVRALKALRG